MSSVSSSSSSSCLASIRLGEICRELPLFVSGYIPQSLMTIVVDDKNEDCVFRQKKDGLTGAELLLSLGLNSENALPVDHQLDIKEESFTLRVKHFLDPIVDISARNAAMAGLKFTVTGNYVDLFVRFDVLSSLPFGFPSWFTPMCETFTRECLRRDVTQVWHINTHEANYADFQRQCKEIVPLVEAIKDVQDHCASWPTNTSSFHLREKAVDLFLEIVYFDLFRCMFGWSAMPQGGPSDANEKADPFEASKLFVRNLITIACAVPRDQKCIRAEAREEDILSLLEGDVLQGMAWPCASTFARRRRYEVQTDGAATARPVDVVKTESKWVCMTPGGEPCSLKPHNGGRCYCHKRCTIYPDGTHDQRSCPLMKARYSTLNRVRIPECRRVPLSQVQSFASRAPVTTVRIVLAHICPDVRDRLITFCCAKRPSRECNRNAQIGFDLIGGGIAHVTEVIFEAIWRELVEELFQMFGCSMKQLGVTVAQFRAALMPHAIYSERNDVNVWGTQKRNGTLYFFMTVNDLQRLIPAYAPLLAPWHRQHRERRHGEVDEENIIAIAPVTFMANGNALRNLHETAHVLYPTDEMRMLANHFNDDLLTAFQRPLTPVNTSIASRSWSSVSPRPHSSTPNDNVYNRFAGLRFDNVE